MDHITTKGTDLVVDQTCNLLERIFPSPRDFAIRLWSQVELPAASQPLFTLVLNHPGALRRIFSPPIELSAGEAYIYGDFDIEGDFFFFLWVIRRPAQPQFHPLRSYQPDQGYSTSVQIRPRA